MTVLEIERGIALAEHKGAVAKAAALKLWLDGLVSAYGDKIIGLDCDTASAAGRLEARAVSAGANPGVADAIIAGTAQAHGLVVVTRNSRHFVTFGVEISSPDQSFGT